nr:unnamed protein product [Digitaria exilis]
MGLLGMEDCTEAVGKKEEPQGRALKFQTRTPPQTEPNQAAQGGCYYYVSDQARLTLGVGDHPPRAEQHRHRKDHRPPPPRRRHSDSRAKRAPPPHRRMGRRVPLLPDGCALRSDLRGAARSAAPPPASPPSESCAKRAHDLLLSLSLSLSLLSNGGDIIFFSTRRMLL